MRPHELGARRVRHVNEASIQLMRSYQNFSEDLSPKFGRDRQALPARCVAPEVRRLTAGQTPASRAPLAG
jgi:hypothetical protein